MTGALVRWARPVVSDSDDLIDIALSAIGLGIEAREVVRRLDGLLRDQLHMQGAA